MCSPTSKKKHRRRKKNDLQSKNSKNNSFPSAFHLYHTTYYAALVWMNEYTHTQLHLCYALTHIYFIIVAQIKRKLKREREHRNVSDLTEQRRRENTHAHTHIRSQAEGERNSFIDLWTIAEITANSRCSSKNEVNKLCSMKHNKQ